MSDRDLRAFMPKQEIRDVLSRYCRGLDRMDKEMAYSVWHQGGTAHYHEIFEGTGHGFIDWVWQAHAAMQCHSHQITNVLIEVDGDTASSEAYVTVVLWTLPDDSGKQTEMVGRGRYLDRWSRRDGVWAIDHREHLLDMYTLHELHKGAISARSTRDQSDPSFGYIRKF
jgi:hypothetical protein